MCAKYFALVLTVWCACALPTPAAATPAERSISTSRQFLVYGSDVRLRGGVCELAEQVKKELLTTLQQRDDWKLPIVIDAQLAQANLPEVPPATVTFSQTEAGLKLQLDLAIRADVGPTDVQREILRALLLEMAYRDQPGLAPGTPYAQPPEWLVEGLLARQPGHETSRAIQPLSVMASANKIPLLKDILTQRSELLDPSSRSIYRACCYAFVELLTSGAGSGRRLVSLIKDLPALSGDPLAVVSTHLPAFANGAESDWKAGVKRLLSAEEHRLRGVAETEEALDHLLVVSVPATSQSARNHRLDDFADFLREPNAPAALQHTSRELLLLGLRANPIYRPVVEEYRQIALLLAQRKTHRIAARLARVKSLRVAVVDRSRLIDDYLNWFEATQGGVQSGLFADYMKAAEHASENRPARHDAISVYLTTLETQLQN